MFSASEKWDYTGDYGYYNRDGEIFVIDKVKDLIKYRIFYLSPTRIENMLLRHPAVSGVAVGSVPHSTNGHCPVAYVKEKCGVEVQSWLFFFLSNKPFYRF